MDDFIRRADAINAMANILVSPITSDDEFNIGVRRCMSSIDAIPAADVRSVVLCKDCKHYGRVDKRRFYRGGDCTKGIIDTIVPDKDYCSRGEER